MDILGEDQRGHEVPFKQGGREPKELHRLKSGHDNPGSAISTLPQKQKKQDFCAYTSDCAKSDTNFLTGTSTWQLAYSIWYTNDTEKKKNSARILKLRLLGQDRGVFGRDGGSASPYTNVCTGNPAQ